MSSFKDYFITFFNEQFNEIELEIGLHSNQTDGTIYSKQEQKHEIWNQKPQGR